MDIRINKLTLQNFKGIKYLEIDAGGANLKIFGDNATGKTTVFDAFTWVLFGKDSLGRSDFGIKTQDENGNAIHNLEHTVEIELSIDETILSLKKIYTEKWTKKRGSAESEFSGHETKYFINEVPSAKKDYEQKIAGFIDENLFKTITNPLFFNEHLKWQDRRAILLNLCSNLTDEEILSKSEEFAPILNELKGRTVQEYKKIIQSKQTAINDELKSIPQRISEATLAIPENVYDVDESEKAIIEQRIAELNDEITTIRNGSGILPIENKIKELKEKKAQCEKSRCDIAELDQELFTAKRNLSNAQHDLNLCNHDIRSLDDTILVYSQTADSFRNEWHEINSKQYTDSGICPTCGQNLPTEQIEKAKAKFNTDKVEKLEAITEKGKRAKAEIEERQKIRAKALETAESLKKKIDEYTAETERLTATIERVMAEFNAIKSRELAELDKHIAEATRTAQNGVESVTEGVCTLQEKISLERARMAQIDKAIANREIAERQKQRIAELSADEKRLAKEYAELDKTAFLIDKFTKYKVDLLSDEINSHFKYAKFKLFDEQINGGIAECCEVTYKGVPYSDLNNAARISIGIDVINTLCQINDKYAPIITDNAESITNIPSTTSQMICLIVSADDDALRVEKI